MNRRSWSSGRLRAIRAGARVPQHGDARPPDHSVARRVAAVRRQWQAGALHAPSLRCRRRPLPHRIRLVGRHRSVPSCDREPGVGGGRPRRRFDSGRQHGVVRGRRLHVGVVPVPRRPRHHCPPRTARQPDRFDHRRCRPGRRELRPIEQRHPPRPRRTRRCCRPCERPHVPRCDPGRRVGRTRCRPVRRHRLSRIQVVVLPSGRRVHDRRCVGRRVVHPRDAGWYAGDDPWKSIYGSPLRLAPDARRFDVSPPWFSFAAAAPTLEMFAELGVATIGHHSVGLANEFRERVGLEPSNSRSSACRATPPMPSGPPASPTPRVTAVSVSRSTSTTRATTSKSAATIVNAER